MGTIAEVVRYPDYPEYPQMHSHSHTFRGPPRIVVENEVAPPLMKDACTSQYYYGWPECSGNDNIPRAVQIQREEKRNSTFGCQEQRTYCF